MWIPPQILTLKIMNAVLSDAPLGALWSSDFKRGSVGFVTLLPNSSLRGYFFYSFAPSVKSLIACLNGMETVRSASSYFNNIFKKKQKTNQQKINLVGFFYNILSFNMSLDTKSYQLWYLSAAVGPSPPSFSPNSTGWYICFSPNVEQVRCLFSLFITILHILKLI